jgi:ribosome-associated translation inhibitor RaiA
VQIQVTTDNHVNGGEELRQQATATVEATLTRFAHQITRVEVHIGDENSHKSGGNDKRCVMEARLAGRQPVAVTHHAASIDEALDGAAERLERLLDSTLGRLAADKKGGMSAAGEQGY